MNKRDGVHYGFRGKPMPNHPYIAAKMLDHGEYTVEIAYRGRGSIVMKKCGKAHTNGELTNYDQFYTFLEQVQNWERVEEMPNDNWEWYDMEFHILGQLCMIHCILGRPILEYMHGYIKIIEIDDPADVIGTVMRKLDRKLSDAYNDWEDQQDKRIELTNNAADLSSGRAKRRHTGNSYRLF